MRNISSTPAAPLLPEHPERFRIARAGIHQVWQYDQVFTFGSGRLLLRGKNGAGKSKALEMLLPFLIDGDPRRIDATGSGRTTLRWLMLDGWGGGANRLGYLWLEFVRPTQEGARLTVGAAIKASTSTNEAKATYFVTPLCPVDDLALHDRARRPSLDRLRELVRPENCYERSVEYRARVARELFGVTDLARYRHLIHLLHGLRRPTIGDRIEAEELAKVLSEGLPPLDDDVIDEVARNLDDLDAVRAELARLERTDMALSTFLTSYRGYLRGVLRTRGSVIRDALEALTRCRRASGDAERELARCRDAEETAKAKVAHWETELSAAQTELRALQDSAAYHALEDLRVKGQAVAALAVAARSAWHAAALARGSEQRAAEWLNTDTEDLGGELTGLGEAARGFAQQARACGLAKSLLDRPPVPTSKVLVARAEDSLSDPDGRQVSVSRVAVHILAATTRQALSDWGHRTSDARAIVQGRARAVAALKTEVARLVGKDTEAERRGQETDLAEGQLMEAQTIEHDQGSTLLHEGDAYVEQTRGWAQHLPEAVSGSLLALLPPTAAEDGPVSEQAVDRQLPRVLHDAAHELLDPLLAALQIERDQVLARQRELTAEHARIDEERRRWERQTDPVRPASPYINAEPDPRTGAPLYLLVDFVEGTDPVRQAALEAALQASGLLGGWVCADGTVLDPATEDVLLCPGAMQVGPTLTHVLRPALPDGCPVAAETVRRLLASVGLGESEASSWVAPDGRWRLGVAQGAFHKADVEYVGAGARAAARERRIAELAATIDALTAELATVRRERDRIEAQQAHISRALRDFPDGHALTSAWTAYDTAVAATARLNTRLVEARRLAEKARQEAAQLRQRVDTMASADGLPTDSEALVRLHDDLGRLRTDLSALSERAARLVSRLARQDDAAEQLRTTQQERVRAEADYGEARDSHQEAATELRILEESVGANEQQVRAWEKQASQRQSSAQAKLPVLRREQSDAHDAVIRAEKDRERAADTLRDQERRTVASGEQLRQPLGMPGLALAAELGEVDGVLTEFDAKLSSGVRERVTALRALCEDVLGRLGPASADVGDSAILRRGEELRDGLAGGFDAAITEVDGIKWVELQDDQGAQDVAMVGRRIRDAAEAARVRLTLREQEVFERYLLGELGDHLAYQVRVAENLVARMNDVLKQVRSSHGIGARLVWTLPAEASADLKAAVMLLRRAAALRTREQSEQLRTALRGLVELQRQADPTASYGVHLRAALDYRSWFAFTVRVTDAARPDREHTLSRRTALSQGEQRVVSYVVLFAAAAAHFTSIGQTAPNAPRLILLDDAFAKIDEPTHANLLGLLVELDLDFICTSERLTGCVPTVPDLHVYECLRDPARRGVATVHYSWDGHRRRLLSV